MPHKIAGFCRHPGCRNRSVELGYCEEHAGEGRQREIARDKHRTPAHKRGYDKRWERYSKWFLAQPGNQLCALRMDAGCAVVAQCVDHIDPPEGATDPRFWDRGNHQPACIHCNSVKGHRCMRGTAAGLAEFATIQPRPPGGS